MFMQLWQYKDIEKQYADFSPYVLVTKSYYPRDYFLMLMYNIFNNCKEKKSKKNLCQETMQKLNV